VGQNRSPHGTVQRGHADNQLRVQGVDRGGGGEGGRADLVPGDQDHPRLTRQLRGEGGKSGERAAVAKGIPESPATQTMPTQLGIGDPARRRCSLSRSRNELNPCYMSRTRSQTGHPTRSYAKQTGQGTEQTRSRNGTGTHGYRG